METESDEIGANTVAQGVFLTQRRKDAKAQWKKESCLASLRLCAFALILLPLCLSAATNDLTSALQKGLFEEEANHNLEAAAQAYQTVSAQFDKDRKLAATAIFRLGEVYRKQGKTNEATTQYERIVREFSDQPTLVTLSRQNLAGLRPSPVLGDVPLLGGRMDAQAQAARQEQKRLLEEQIKLAELDVKETKALAEQGLAPQANIRTKEREVLNLRSQLAALDLAPQETTGVPLTTDEEEKEIRRIQAMIKNSPDLINAPALEGGFTPLYRSAWSGWLRVAKFLLDNGAAVNAPAVSHGRTFDGWTPLIGAANEGHKAMVELLLDRGADANLRDPSGKVPLHLAAENGFQSVVEALLARKADVNAQTKKQETPLLLAAAKGHSAMVDLLIAKGAQVDAKDARGWTALIAAAFQGNSPVVKRLLEAGANPNVSDGSGRTALSYAVPHGAGLVTALVEGKADPNAGSAESPLLQAVRAENAALTELLLRAGADPNQPTGCTQIYMSSQSGRRSRQGNGNPVKRTPLQAAVLEEYPAMAKLLLQFKGDAKAKNDGDTLLVLEALNNTEILKALLEAGADANARYEKGYSALIVAAANGNSAAVELLVNHGADVNVREDQGQGRTPLYLSADRGDKKSVELLLNAKADVNAVTPGNLLTALHRAVSNGSGEIAEMLLAHGANPNLKDNTGNTPLLWALGIGGNGIGAQKIMVELLLSKGADPNLRNNDGRTALDLAKGVNSPPAPGFAGFGQPPPGVPTRPVRQPVVSEGPAKAEPVDLPALLRQHGALDDLPDFTSIRLTRGTLSQTTIFYKDANAENGFTLFEVLASHYDRSKFVTGSFSDRINAFQKAQSNDPLRFPDLTRIRIQRASASKPTERKEITVTLLGTNNSIDCTKDLPLEFGDAIEIPEREHTLAEPAVGLTDPQGSELTKCTDRRVRFVVRGETAEVTVHGYGAYLSPALNDSQVQKILRSSSDLSRLKVKRTDPKSGKPREILFDAEKSRGVDDLWLRDGDVIEVPDKP